jgi:uncharacterized protein (DUF302 family)
MSESEEYALRAVLDAAYDDVLARLEHALKEEGFGILTSLDMQAILRDKLGAKFRRYNILGACNPPLAKRALDEDLDAGLILPCSIVIYEQNGTTIVSIANPMRMMETLDNPDLRPIAEEVGRKLERVLRSLTASS